MRRTMLTALTISLALALHASKSCGQSLEPLDAARLRQKPITTVSGPVGALLKEWWHESTAAGNIGDYYDNRDGDHSPLNRGLFPQLLVVKYSPQDIKLRKHWAAQHIIHPAVVFGNSSTSAPPTHGGSNPRIYYTNPRGLLFLAAQYAKNNLYIYPEHRDHDPGHNGKGDGFGDLYPTNTPYLLISQGSSGSDQPFMRAVPLTLAAFRPEVKKKLTETGTLMPTLQMILRRTYKPVKGPDDYLTGKAHPSVFEGSQIDELAMVKLAHAMELKALPPLVHLKVVEETPAKLGVDYFEMNLSERLADTPAAIARIHRSKERTRRLVVSAEGSLDLEQGAADVQVGRPARRSGAHPDQAAQPGRLGCGDHGRLSRAPADRAGLVDGVEPRRYRRLRPQRHALLRAGIRHVLHARQRIAHLRCQGPRRRDRLQHGRDGLSRDRLAEGARCARQGRGGRHTARSGPPRPGGIRGGRAAPCPSDDGAARSPGSRQGGREGGKDGER